MAIFPYKKTFPVADNTTVILKIKFPDPGTAGYHSIDIAGPNDKKAYNECSVTLGIGKDLKKERTIVFSKVNNMDIDNEDVSVKYYLNDILVQEHTNKKNIDYSPIIKVTINFIDNE
jgi:hypothetical protein